MKKRIVLLLCVLFFVGCSKKEEPTTLVLDWTINTNHTGLYVAQELGYYKDEGINLEIVAPPEDGALNLVAANKANYAISFQEVLAPGLAQDEPLPVSAVASVVNHNRSGLLSLKKSNIKSPKDLEGKNLASWGTDMFDAVISDLVTKDGGDYKKVKQVQTSITDPVAALNGEIDAVWVYYSWDVMNLLKNNIEFEYIDIPSQNNVFDYYSPMLVVNDDYAAKNKEEVEKFLKATQKGYEYAIKNPDKAADILLKYAPELDKDIVLMSQKYLAKEYQSDAPYWGHLDKKRWNYFYKWLYDNKLVDRSIEDKGLNTSFIEAIK